MTVASNKLRSASSSVISDEPTFEAIFLEHYAQVYGVLFRLVGDRAAAEDLTLETFWRLWERAPHTAEHLGGWLYRVATHLGYNALRAAKRRTNYEVKAGRYALEHDSPPDPAHEAERRDERARVREVLRRMRPREAQLLILRHSGLAYKEIATALGVAPGSIGTLLARAEKEFEKLYSEGG